MLEVGQTVYLQVKNGLLITTKNDTIEEMIVHNANKTTAYIWHANEKNEENHKVFYKVNQKTLETKCSASTEHAYKLWLTKEAYLDHIEATKKEEVTC